jgi:hypothetical protein
VLRAERNSAGEWEVENDYLLLRPFGGHNRGVLLIDKRRGTESQVSFWLRETSDEKVATLAQQTEDSATVVLSASDWKGRLTWHAWLTLTNEVASVAARFAVFNRSFSPVRVSPHIEVSPTNELAIVPVRHSAYRYEIAGAAGVVGAFFDMREVPVAPHDTACIEARVLPCGLGRIDFASKHLAARLDEERLALASAETRHGHRLLVGVDGKTMEMQVDMSPESDSSIDLASLGGRVERCQVRDPRGEVILDSMPPAQSDTKLPMPPISSIENLLWDDDGLASAERDPSVAHAAAFARGLLQLRKRNWAEAADRFEDSLLRSSDDPLAWWAKNWCLRELGQENEHDLANAHYLAPTEPILRADAYLSAPESAKPEHLLDAWGSNPQPFLEVSDLLDQAGLEEPRARWLEEARRRAPCALIERLLAAAHLAHSRELAAMEHVRCAENAKDLADAFRPSEVRAEARLIEWLKTRG